MANDPAPEALACWQCAGDVPASARPSPFCSYACRDTYWGTSPASPRCRNCGTPAASCAVLSTARCCSWCNHLVALTDDAAVRVP